MQKSKYIFVILAAVYLAMGILYPLGILQISSNLLLGLSVSALLLSISDITGKISDLLCLSNLYNAELNTTVDFIEEKIKQGGTNTKNINIRNVNESIKGLMKKGYVFCHPIDYVNRNYIKLLKHLSSLFFILGISAFIIMPFITADFIDNVLASMITIFAFSAMTLSLYFDETFFEVKSRREAFIDKNLLIQSEYPDFLHYFQLHMFYRNDLNALEGVTSDSKDDVLRK